MSKADGHHNNNAESSSVVPAMIYLSATPMACVRKSIEVALVADLYVLRVLSEGQGFLHCEFDAILKLI